MTPRSSLSAAPLWLTAIAALLLTLLIAIGGFVHAAFASPPLPTLSLIGGVVTLNNWRRDEPRGPWLGQVGTPRWWWTPDLWQGGPDWFMRVPLWPLALACAVAAGLLLRTRRIRSVRCRTNMCLRCGYPRHSLPPGAPCPECAAAPDV